MDIYNPNSGEWVWVRPAVQGEFQIPYSGKVIKVKKSKIQILTENVEEKDIDAKDVLGPVKQADIPPFDDMINLSDLQERSILRNIHLRYLQDAIYTYTGGILVAVNPYKPLNVYTEEDIKNYQGKRLTELKPHLFAIGAQALTDLKRHLHNQCIVISGETGSGKTESTKLLLNFLAATTKSDTIGKKIVLANPILEAFGNAKTTKNDNSSRFGKYIEISFRQDGSMRSGWLRHYLLEKARIKSQNPGDRNYHVFYTILAGLPIQSKASLRLTRPDDYYYLKQGNAITCHGRDEKEEFQMLKKAFETLNFTDAETWMMYQVLAAILHIGNLRYITTAKGNDEVTHVVRNAHLEMASSLLSLNEEHFIEALTLKTIMVEGTKVVSQMSQEQAIRNRDAFAMSLYNQLFSYILTAINKSVSDHKVSRTNLTIGILDIFGFENFANNSFEQLCINYANEHLQQFFVKHVFKVEQEEYLKEGIAWEKLSYEDNKAVLSLIGTGPMSIMNILNEQTKFPKGCDEGIILKCNQNHSKNKHYLKSKSDVSSLFGVKHFAGTVSYSVEGFVEKNMNSLGLEWREVIRESGNQFLKNLFVTELNGSVVKGAGQTLAGQYTQSLESLMTTLSCCMPFFIRCIKPNSSKLPNVFDRELVCMQLRYSGMMETARIRQIGFPIRYTYVQFVIRYRVLIPGTPSINRLTDFKEASRQICERYLRPGEYKYGKTKVFLKIPDEKLEAIRDEILSKNAVVIQKNFRATRLRIRYLRQREAALKIQRYWRGFRPRSTYRLIQNGYLRLQAVVRSRHQVFIYNKMKHQIIRLQARCRGFLKRKQLKSSKKPKLLPKPVPKPRKVSIPEVSIDSFITDIFENAIQGRLDAVSTDVVDYLQPSQTDIASEILKDKSVLSFPKFAAANFTGNINCKFTKKLLDQPLLDFKSPGDQMAAPVLWVTILRFMGDLPENVSSSGPVPRTRKSIMSQLQATISKSYLHSKDFQKVLAALKEEEMKEEDRRQKHGRSRLVNLTLMHRNKLLQELQRAQMESDALKGSYLEWLRGPPTTLLDKLYFILGHAILRPTLRDEIYCQLCKQLTDNPNPVSCMYGWILFSLCSTTFPPTPRLAPTVLHFIASSGNMLGALRKLSRTIENGARLQPPSAFELSALKNQEKMSVEVFLLDDTTVHLEVDPATTAKEMIKIICSKKNIEDSTGYSIFLSMFGQVISLEDNGRFLMDGVCQCEMRASERGLPEITAPWSVVFRREVFPPGPISPSDALSLHLSYSQVIKGVTLGEYRLSQECELSLLVAQHYYIIYGKNLLPEILDSLIKEVIPEPILKKKNNNWSKSVADAFSKSYFIKLKVPEEDVKMNVINFSRKKWPILFSRYYEVTQLSGILLSKSEILLAINSEGLFICENSGEIILDINYVEIVSIDYMAGSSIDYDQIHLVTTKQQKYVFRSSDAQLVCSRVNSILDELLIKSKYAVVLDDYSPPDESFLRLRRGDLVTFTEVSTDDKWMRGHLVDSPHVGEFPRKLVRILPTYEKPPVYLLVDILEERAPNKYQTKGKTLSLLVKKHSLEGYAKKYFKLDAHAKGSKKDEFWTFSSNKLWSPLHRSLSPLSQVVTSIFSAILHYMGDRPLSGQPRYTRPIFEPPLQHEVLRDELYCLLLKQLTGNPTPDSTDRGWELLHLAMCLFSPSSILIKDVEEWLDTRPGERSWRCSRLLSTVRVKGPRLLSHHWQEVLSAQDLAPILLPVSFPNGIQHIFEVTSHSTVSEVVEEISSWLGLTSCEGFTIIVIVNDLAVPLCFDEYIFDGILHACQFPSSANGHETPSYTYDLMFVRKLWMNTYAGLDRTADLVCHYYQELPKYLAGSHNCTATDAMYLGALIFIAETDETRGQINLQSEIMRRVEELVPAPLVNGMSPQEWMYGIVRHYEQNKDLKSDDAKIMFLKVTQSWPNFGSAFFRVNASSSFQDEPMTLVVNRNGICLVHPFSQEIITCHGYAELIGCKHTDISLVLSTPHRHYTWYTRTAPKIADLIQSYLDAFDSKYLVR